MSEKKFTLPQLIITFTKKIINILFTIIKYCKKNFEIYSLAVAIISIFLALTAFLQSKKAFSIAQETASSTQLAVQIANENLQLFKSEIDKRTEPFFNFQYSDDKKAFTVTAPANINIKTIDWYLPDVPDHRFYHNDYLKLYNQSQTLTSEEIKEYLTKQLLAANGELTAEQVKGWLRCGLMTIHQNYSTPVKILIYFNIRGESKINYLIYNFYFTAIASDSPKIYGPLDVLNDNELNKQFSEKIKNYSVIFKNQTKDGARWLNNPPEYFNKVINGDVDCDKYFWGEPILFGEYIGT